MSGSPGDDQPPASESVAEQVRRKGVRPIESVADMAQPGIFESDEELEAFLAYVRAARHGGGDAYRPCSGENAAYEAGAAEPGESIRDY